MPSDNQKNQTPIKKPQQNVGRDQQSSRNLDKKPASGEQIPNRNPQDQQRSR